jgi:hypothetical protein
MLYKYFQSLIIDSKEESQGISFIFLQMRRQPILLKMAKQGKAL